ncbi:hypothetical protein K523DRAFT_105217 [Schizophyllum commune Tattone D]|nr:hypothetical protein K523DRAFT_105217 [Schizophyllum commune Tattone D]
MKETRIFYEDPQQSTRIYMSHLNHLSHAPDTMSGLDPQTSTRYLLYSVSRRMYQVQQLWDVCQCILSVDIKVVSQCREKTCKQCESTMGVDDKLAAYNAVRWRAK